MLNLDYAFCLNKDCDGKTVLRDGVGKESEVIPAALEYVATYDYWECPYCGSEVWMGVDSKPRGRVSAFEARQVLKDERRRQQSMRKKGSGGGSSGKSRKKQVKFEPFRIPNDR